MVKKSEEDKLDNKDNKKSSFNLPHGWELHHIKPISKGGTNSIENLIMVPAYINNLLGNRYLRDSSYDDVIKYLSEVSKRNKKFLPITNSEIQKINSLKTEEECYEYILNKNKKYSFLDSFLILFDNILKILPVVMLSSLPLLLLTNIGNTDYNFSVLYSSSSYIYGLMFISLVISIFLRWLFKNKSLAIEQYLIAVNKKLNDMSSKDK